MADYAGQVAVVTGDVADDGQIGAIMGQMAQAHGGINILISNAGLHAHEYSRPLAELGLAKIRRLFEVNVMGTVVCTLAAAPYLAGRKGASIMTAATPTMWPAPAMRRRGCTAESRRRGRRWRDRPAAPPGAMST
jgi:NAD(P)-dependent dehydrogenase (short-subunit alcohol dehydrogenase family)